MDTKIKTKLDLGYTVYDWSPRINLNNYSGKDPIFRGINPVTYTFNGTIYTIHVYRDSTLAY